MIKFQDLPEARPYKKFKDLYNKAFINGQQSIEAICISSSSNNEVDSRFVNLKYIIGNEWIFFSNYKSPKAIQFLNNNNIACVFYWNKTNTQVRIKATIKKTSNSFSDNHFKNRSKEKNALAISSNQSELIDSYENVIKNYEHIINNIDLNSKRPPYWGGYTFIPYHFEFWEGHDSRLNKREVFCKNGDDWNSSIIQP
tara:strand:- start:1437 stop:2030 length:594 start_codon:yes stop_codon:yes gene_type:complete